MAKKKYANPRERFLDVAEARTNAVLEKIRILGNCSNRQLYQYTEEEINKIFKILSEELETSRQKFIVQTKPKKRKFRL